MAKRPPSNLRAAPADGDFSTSAVACGVCGDHYSPAAQASACPHQLTDSGVASKAEAAVVAACREDVNDFCEYVLRDEETHERIQQQPMHVRMHRVLEEHGRAVIMAHPESGKSSQISIGRVLWLLGKNPGLRLAIICNTQTAAKKLLRLIKQYIESSEELHRVFPALLPGEQWAEGQITVRRPTLSKDPTIQTLGHHGDIQGSRVDGVVADDLLDFELCRNEQVRKDVSAWWKSAVMARLTQKAWVAFLTNAWHQSDLAHELESMGWPTLRFPVLDDEGRSTWPARWPIHRIEKVRREDMGELEFTRLHMCKPRDDGAVVFLPAAIEKCKRLGQGYGLVQHLDDATLERLEAAGGLVVTGVDLAVTRRLSGAVTCAFTLLFHPGGLRQVLGIRSGRWGGRQILANLAEVGLAYGGVIVVENNAGQQYLVEIAQEAGDGATAIPVPVVPFFTGANKVSAEYGVDSMASEFESGRWVVPVGAGVLRAGARVHVPDKEVATWLDELTAYDPASHSGDRLMASWIARTWGSHFLRRRRTSQQRGGVTARTLG